MPLGNYRTGYEPTLERGSPFVPAYAPEYPRSLVLPRPDEIQRPPGAEATLPLDQLPPAVAALVPDMQRLVMALDAALRARPLPIVEYPFQGWRVDRLALVNTAVTWLDEFQPVLGGQQRYLKGRRAIIIVNHDLTNAVYIRHADSAVAAQGGFLAAGGSITLPLGEKCTVFATAIAATSTVSFYQFN